MYILLAEALSLFTICYVFTYSYIYTHACMYNRIFIYLYTRFVYNYSYMHFEVLHCVKVRVVFPHVYMYTLRRFVPSFLSVTQCWVQPSTSWCFTSCFKKTARYGTVTSLVGCFVCLWCLLHCACILHVCIIIVYIKLVTYRQWLWSAWIIYVCTCM